MDYTREPIIESVITSKEGCKLVIRSSKGMSQEEYFVDAVELVAFGAALFFRSLEKPKPFLLPVQDYEVLEVREPRMVLKNVGVDRSIKIGSEKKPPQQQKQQVPKQEQPEPAQEEDKSKRQKRSHRRRGKNSEAETQEEQPQVLATEEESAKALSMAPSPSAMSALLAPPTTLISETLTRYRRDEAFKQAFYEKEEAEANIIAPPLPTDAEFDEGDHILFRGHESTDYKPYTEEPIEDPNAIDPFNQKEEEFTELPFEDRDEHL